MSKMLLADLTSFRRGARMSPLLQSQARRPIWWIRLLDLRFATGCLLVAWLIISDYNPRLFAQPNFSTEKSNPTNSRTTGEFPRWEDIDAALTDFFKQEPNHQQGDLVTREQAERFLKLLPAFGWPLEQAGQAALMEKMISEKHFLAQNLRTTAGTKFMRKISQYPRGYDRVHRLTGLKGGKDRLKELIRDPAGYKLIEYMTKSDGGKNMGLLLGGVPGGKEFNSPTGFAYTADTFRTRLQDLHMKCEMEQKPNVKKTPTKK